MIKVILSPFFVYHTQIINKVKLLISNKDLINELKKRPLTGNSLLVKKFYKPMVKTVSIRYKLDKLDAQDVVNESLFKVIRKINGYEYETESKFFNWLYTIVKNTTFDFLRKKKQERERLHTISRDSRFLTENLQKDQYINEDVLDSDISYSLENKNEQYSESENVDNIVDKNTASEYLNSYFNSANSKTSKEMDQLIEILEEFSIDEQCFIIMRVDNISMKEIAKIRNSTVVATKQYISRLMKKFFVKVAEKLEINNYKELYENFKKQDKLSNSPGNIKQETTRP